MVLLINDPKPYYTIQDLHCMNLLKHPVWVFDIDERSMHWANIAALDVWNATSLEELLQRDFATDMSDASITFLDNVKQKIIDQHDAVITEQWTFYPRGMSATTVDITCSGIRIRNYSSNRSDSPEEQHDEGRIAMLVETEMYQNKRIIADHTLRTIEILKHIPVAVSQFTMDGSLLYQNQKATSLFGTSSSDVHHSSSLEDLNTTTTSNSSARKVHNEEQKSSDCDDCNNDNNQKDNGTSTTSSEPQKQQIQDQDHPAQENILLRRFVDVEVGRKAMELISESNEEYSAEVQLYTDLSSSAAAATPLSSSQHQQPHNKQKRRKNQRWFNLSLRRARDPVTSDNVILYIARDISDIVKARKDSLRAAMKSEFLDVMAHEIRTPLHQIVGHADLLEDPTSGNVLNIEQRTSVIQIQTSCSMLISIINDLLDCSKLENGNVQTEIIPFVLPKLIDDCIESIRPQSNMKGLQLLYEIQPECHTHLLSDPNRLRQIILNLLSNAVKFSHTGSISLIIKPYSFTTDLYSSETGTRTSSSDTSSIVTASSGTTMTVTPSLHDDHNTEPSLLSSKYQHSQQQQRQQQHQQWLRFEVTDTGIGIDPSEQKVVFERYRQANASVARQFGGTGLGLPICKGLVELLGGTIGLHSEVGKGTTVYFDLPFQIDPCSLKHHSTSMRSQDILEGQHHDDLPPLTSTTANTTSTTSASTTSSSVAAPETQQQLLPMNVLVVEDNLINQKVVRAMLQRLGHNVTVAENGEVALSKIRENQFQLVLMDVQMPVMDGIECTKYIRQVLQYNKSQLPIIGLTAAYQQCDSEYYENEVGMNSCVGKPLPMPKLKEALAQYQQNGSQLQQIGEPQEPPITAVTTILPNASAEQKTEETQSSTSIRSVLHTGVHGEIEIIDADRHLMNAPTSSTSPRSSSSTDTSKSSVTHSATTATAALLNMPSAVSLSAVTSLKKRPYDSSCSTGSGNSSNGTAGSASTEQQNNTGKKHR